MDIRSLEVPDGYHIARLWLHRVDREGGQDYWHANERTAINTTPICGGGPYTTWFRIDQSNGVITLVNPAHVESVELCKNA